MSRIRSVAALTLCAALGPALLACPGQGSSRSLFTIALFNDGESPSSARPHTLIYAAWGPEPTQDLPPCTFFVYDLAGEGHRYTRNPGPPEQYVLSHQETQGTDTYAQFMADETQSPDGNCAFFDSQVDAGDRFILTGSLVARFDPSAPLPNNVTVDSPHYVATGTYSTSPGGPTQGVFYFYDFEIDRSQPTGLLLSATPGR